MIDRGQAGGSSKEEPDVSAGEWFSGVLNQVRPITFESNSALQFEIPAMMAIVGTKTPPHMKGVSKDTDESEDDELFYSAVCFELYDAQPVSDDSNLRNKFKSMREKLRKALQQGAA